MTPQRVMLVLSLGLAANGQTPPANSRVGVFRYGYFWVLDANGDNQFTAAPPDLALPFGGVAGDIPITGDWNGNGFTEVGIYRPSNGYFILDTNGNGQVDAEDQFFNLGVGQVAGDIPVVGDWNGDGRTKVGIFRNGYYWILDTNGNGVFEAGIDKAFAYGGIAGDIPVVGDWTGTGISKVGIYRPGAIGAASYWLLDANGDGAYVGPPGDYYYQFGIGGDVPVVGDWSGTGTSKIGVFRGGSEWLLDVNGDGVYDTGDLAFYYGGIGGDVPVVGKWNAAEQQTDTQPVCVSTSGSCMATPQTQALPVMNTNTVSSTPAQTNPPYTMLTVQFTNSNGYAAITGGQILVNVDTTTPPAALNGCLVWFYANFPPGQQPEFSLWMPDVSGSLVGIGPGVPPYYDNACGFAASASSVTYSGSTITLNLALYFQPGFSGPHAIYASGQTSSYLDSPWIELGMIGIQPPPAIPAVTVTTPPFATILPGASNTQIPLEYLLFNTAAAPITYSAPTVPDPNNSSNVITTTFQQSPASGTTTASVSVPPGMTPGVYNVPFTAYDPVSGARSQRSMSITVQSASGGSSFIPVPSDGDPVYMDSLPNGYNCTGGDNTFGVFSVTDPSNPASLDWYFWSTGGGLSQYDIYCGSLLYPARVVTPEPPEIDGVANPGTPLFQLENGINQGTAAIDTSGHLMVWGANLWNLSVTPDDTTNITMSVDYAEGPGLAGSLVLVYYSIGPNASTGPHTFTLTNDQGSATGGYQVGDATPVLYSISPSVFVAGQTYTNVTILGIHLGTNCTTPTFSGAGGTYFTTDCTQSGDTQIVGTLAVDPNAPATNSASVSVTATGYNGLAFAPQVADQPSSAILNNITIAYFGSPITAQVSVTGQPGQAGQQQVLQGQWVYITADPNSGSPAMPQLSAQLFSGNSPILTGNVRWMLGVSFSRQGGPGPDTAYYPTVSGQTLPANVSFVPTYGTFQGGIATLSWTYLGNPQSSGQLTFEIRGQNPAPSQIYNYFQATPVSGMWFFGQLIWQESGWHQYGPLFPCNTSGNADGYPCFGGPHGFGVMQIDNTPSATSADLWNWQENVQDGQAKATTFRDQAYTAWKRQISDWMKWNIYHSPQAAAPGDVTTGSCTFSFSLQSQFTNSIGVPHSFGDALWIRYYNGSNPYYLSFLNSGSWAFAKDSYVANVCGQSNQPPTP